jgi:hypothetical protein
MARVTAKNSGVRLELSVLNAAAVIGNLRAFDRRLQDDLRAVNEETGEDIRALTYELCPVDTGFMREHIVVVFSEGGMVVEVGWQASDFFEAGLVFYPFFVIFGTVSMPARPVLQSAYAHFRPIHIKRVSDAMRRSVARGSRRRRRGG